MVIASARADLTYQQGTPRHFFDRDRFDKYWPSLAHIGEQPVYNREIYTQDDTTDSDASGTPDNEEVFGYQEAWAHYRYKPSTISGKFRSDATGTLDNYHLSEEFGSLPVLDSTFIQDSTPRDRDWETHGLSDQ